MKTAFTPEQLRDPALAEADAILQSCVHYGFCTATCPTYVVLGDENDSPRGRIDLIRTMLESGGAPDAKTVGHIDRCLSCLSCMTTCAAKVDYMHLVDRARIHIEQSFARPLADRIRRWLVGAVVPYPARFRAAIRLAGLARLFSALVPRALRPLIALAPTRLPPADPQIRPQIFPSEGERRMRVALLTGCAQTVLMPQINAATIRLLTRHGCEVIIAERAGCCGALTLHMGREDQAKRDAASCITAWHGLGDIDAVVVNAAGCGTTVKDYGHLFARDPALSGAAAAVSALTLDLTELMSRLTLNTPSITPGHVVAYHDACSLQHGQRITEQPRALLRRAGFVVRDVPEKHFCCGSAGSYNLLQPELAALFGSRKATNIDSTGAELVAAGNIGCLVQIGTYSGLAVVHTAELLDWATGGPRPAGLVDLPEPELVTAADDQTVAFAAPVGDGFW